MRVFPIHAQIGVFENEKDIDRWMLSNKFHPIDYFTFIKHSPYIFTPFTHECVKRYNYFKTYGIHQFSNIMEEIPNWWCEMLDVMEAAGQEAVEEHRKSNAKR